MRVCSWYLLLIFETHAQPQHFCGTRKWEIKHNTLKGEHKSCAYEVSAPWWVIRMKIIRICKHAGTTRPHRVFVVFKLFNFIYITLTDDCDFFWKKKKTPVKVLKITQSIFGSIYQVIVAGGMIQILWFFIFLGFWEFFFLASSDPILKSKDTPIHVIDAAIFFFVLENR